MLEKITCPFVKLSSSFENLMNFQGEVSQLTFFTSEVVVKWVIDGIYYLFFIFTNDYKNNVEGILPISLRTNEEILCSKY